MAPDLLDDETHAKVAEIVAGTAAFDFAFARMDTFPNGIIHLLPEPEDPFRRLTDALASAFPQCPPYAGEFATSARTSRSTPSRPRCPWRRRHGAARRPRVGAGARCRAERLDLVHYAPGALRVLRSWSFC